MNDKKESTEYQIPAIAIAMQDITGSPSARAHISGVHFGEQHIVATNGHVLIAHEIQKDDNHKLPTGETWRFPAPEVLEGCENENEDGDCCGYEPESQPCLPVAKYVKRENKAHAIGITTDAKVLNSEDTFPDYRYLFKDVDIENRFTFSLNPDFLVQLAKILSFKNPNMVTLSIDTKDPLASIIITGNKEGDAVGMLMPMRGPEKGPVEIAKRLQGKL